MSQNKIVTALSKTLAEEYILMLKTQNFHWNVEGPLFYSLHMLFEQHYTFLATKVDEVAERIRALGFKAPGSFQEFHKISSIHEAASDNVNASQMIELLTKDHTYLVGELKQNKEEADKVGDNSSAALYDDLIAFHEKAAWMIRSHRS